MTAGPGRRWWLAAAGAVLVVLAVAAGFVLKERTAAPAERSELLLLTSLPIAFPEEFTLNAKASPVITVLRSRYAVMPISVADAQSLRGHRLLLMIQPQAQPAEVLVDLDDWVRKGGRVLLFADPLLEWPSERPLGDVRRPPLAFADTGLLEHWGLRLDAPDSLGPATFVVEGKPVHALAPGTLAATGPGCRVGSGGLTARCRLGRGEAIVVADADVLDVERRSDPARTGNLDFLMSQLEELRR